MFITATDFCICCYSSVPACASVENMYFICKGPHMETHSDINISRRCIVSLPSEDAHGNTVTHFKQGKHVTSLMPKNTAATWFESCFKWLKTSDPGTVFTHEGIAATLDHRVLCQLYM